MDFHLKLNNEKLQSLNGQLAYINEALSQKDIEAWELREFTAAKCDIIKEIWETEELIERIKEIS